MLLLAVETVVAGLLHQKVFDHALVLGLLHGPRVGLAHVHVVAGKYQVKYKHSLSLHSCYYHYRKDKRNAWKVTIVSTTRLTTFKVKVLVTLFRSKAFLLFPYYCSKGPLISHRYLTYRTGPA